MMAIEYVTRRGCKGLRLGVVTERHAICEDCDHWNDNESESCDLIRREVTASGQAILVSRQEPAPCLYAAALRGPATGCPLKKW